MLFPVSKKYERGRNMKGCVVLVFLLLTLFLTRAHGLQLLLLEVPATADILSPVTLRCEYHLQGGKLYSVKWYKDGAEFFRFMPDYVPESRAVKSSGLSVDLQNSDMNMVTLTNLRFNNSGNYKCEVSTEAPNFETVAQSSNMTVMAYPSEDPKIEGVQESYNVGDYVSANCTSGKSRPAAELTWHVNGVKVSQQADSWVWEYKIGYDDSDIQGLRTKTLGLHFQILNSHSGTSKLEIRCTAKVGASTRQTSVTPAIDRTMTSHKLHQERPNNAASLFVPALNFVLISIASWHVLLSS